ncbi:MAG: hypothetical protein ACSW8D_00885 [Prevotella sp.]|jgi:hypothetical protein
MFDYRGLHDLLFFALYIGAAFFALMACLYLLLRRDNAIAGDVRSSRRLRRWTALLLAAIVASHVYRLPRLARRVVAGTEGKLKMK